MPHLLRLQIGIIAQAQDGLQRGMGAMATGMKLVQDGLKFPTLAKPLERISRGVCLRAMGRRKALVAFQCARSCQEPGLGKKRGFNPVRRGHAGMKRFTHGAELCA